MLKVLDRGPTRGHRYVVMDGRKRVAVFNTAMEASEFVEGGGEHEVDKPKSGWASKKRKK